MSNKITYIQSSEHAIVGESGGVAATLAPGDRVLFNEEADSHKYLKRLIEAKDPSVAHLSLLEVDPEQEAKAEEERAEMLVKAEKIAAEARAEQDRKELEEFEERQGIAQSQRPHADPTDFPPQDEEAQRVGKLSGAGQRASTQVDVADEDQNEEGAPAEKSSPKQGRRRSSSKGG